MDASVPLCLGRSRDVGCHVCKHRRTHSELPRAVVWRSGSLRIYHQDCKLGAARIINTVDIGQHEIQCGGKRRPHGQRLLLNSVLHTPRSTCEARTTVFSTPYGVHKQHLPPTKLMLMAMQQSKPLKTPCLYTVSSLRSTEYGVEVHSADANFG